MKEITLEEKKKLMLEMLEEIDTFCMENNIKYFLTGGTLIGAIRHNGFIPWDDDVDIALLRKDYEKLLNEFSSKSENIEIIDYKKRKNYIWPSAKIIHNKTYLIESNIKKSSIGVFLDMFPIDYVGGSYDDVKKYVKKACKWRNILTIKHLETSKNRSFSKNMLIIVARILNLIPDKFIIKKLELLSKKYENQPQSDFVCNFAGAWGLREIVRREFFDTAINHRFENLNLCVPIGYDGFLKAVYGDYMTPPPLNKQKSTHTLKEYYT